MPSRPGERSNVDPADVRRVQHWPASQSETIVPSVSVLIPCFRAERYIGGALKSVAGQLGLPAGCRVEVVIVIDGRTSDAEAVHQWLSDDSRYAFSAVVIQLARNVGAGLARCHAWQYCRGDLVAFLDDDDVWHPDKLATQWRLHELHPDQIASGHLYGPFSTPGLPERGEDFFRASQVRTVGFRSLLIRSPLPTPTLVLRRKLWPQGPESYRFGEDSLMKLMVAHEQPFMEVQHILAGPSPDALPVIADCDSLTRQRWPTRRAQWRNYMLLVRRGALPPWLLPPLLILSGLLLVRRLGLDAVERYRSR